MVWFCGDFGGGICGGGGPDTLAGGFFAKYDRFRVIFCLLMEFFRISTDVNLIFVLCVRCRINNYIVLKFFIMKERFIAFNSEYLFMYTMFKTFTPVFQLNADL